MAIPVFPSRTFRHRCIFVNAASGIERPEDLRGKRMGVPEYSMTAAVWLRGLFQHEYGVPPEQIYWVQAGEEHPGGKIAWTLRCRQVSEWRQARHDAKTP